MTSKQDCALRREANCVLVGPPPPGWEEGVGSVGAPCIPKGEEASAAATLPITVEALTALFDSGPWDPITTEAGARAASMAEQRAAACLRQPSQLIAALRLQPAAEEIIEQGEENSTPHEAISAEKVEKGVI